MKAKLKISEDLRLQCLEEKTELELKIADIVDAHGVELADVVAAHEMKMDAMRFKLKKIRKYVISQEAWYHYAVDSIVTDRKSTRLNSSHITRSRMPSSA